MESQKDVSRLVRSFSLVHGSVVKQEPEVAETQYRFALEDIAAALSVKVVFLDGSDRFWVLLKATRPHLMMGIKEQEQFSLKKHFRSFERLLEWIWSSRLERVIVDGLLFEANEHFTRTEDTDRFVARILLGLGAQLKDLRPQLEEGRHAIHQLLSSRKSEDGGRDHSMGC